jgi:hypothetical protein
VLCLLFALASAMLWREKKKDKPSNGVNYEFVDEGSEKITFTSLGERMRYRTLARNE